MLYLRLLGLLLICTFFVTPGYEFLIVRVTLQYDRHARELGTIGTDRKEIN